MPCILDLQPAPLSVGRTPALGAGRQGDLRFGGGDQASVRKIDAFYSVIGSYFEPDRSFARKHSSQAVFSGCCS